MYKNKQFDEWNQLEQQVRQRLQGHRDEAFEKQLQNDDFLQTIVAGLEQQLKAQPELAIADLVSDKKLRIWKQMVPARSANPILRFAQQLRDIWLELRRAQCHYLLGLNGSCVVLILAFGLWINFFQPPEEVSVLAQVEILEGFKQ